MSVEMDLKQALLEAQVDASFFALTWEGRYDDGHSD